jgi:Zn-dependent peptidase ImmA (M78 family)
VSGTIELARAAVKAAMNVRVEHQLDPYLSICVYDLVERSGVELRFLAAPSLEGIYSAGEPPIIAISSLRRSGRQRFTCAHELGHHVFGHGTRIDEFDGQQRKRRFDPREFIVDCFADFLLMPKLAVVSALRALEIDLQTATPRQLFALAGYFGVGYRTIVHHLSKNLGLIAADRATRLGRARPQALREELVPGCGEHDVFVADRHWRGRPIDLHIGDFLVLTDGGIAESAMHLEPWRSNGGGVTFRAVQPGITRVTEVGSDWTSYVRVACRPVQGNFVGRSLYRHEPESEFVSVH